jgi:hypothetical protein
LVERHEPSPLERFCAVLAEHGVEFIVVGGQAEALMGSARSPTTSISATGVPPRTWSGWPPRSAP